MSMNPLQQTQLDILLEMERVCKKNNIRYHLFSGTLLGAIRHQGFIPWDDDIDVVMMRDEYERFLRLPQSEFGERYFVQTNMTDAQYDNIYAKLRDSSTTYVEDYLADKAINHGVFIDIFPLDGFPSNTLVQKAFWWPLSLFGYIATLKAFIKEPKERVRIPALALMSITPLSGATMMKIYGKMMSMVSVRRADLVGFLAHPGFPIKHVAYDRSWFDRTLLVRFEGHDLPVPADFHLILTQLFGDYMVPPPLKDRCSHHNAKAISTTVPFTDRRKAI